MRMPFIRETLDNQQYQYQINQMRERDRLINSVAGNVHLLTALTDQELRQIENLFALAQARAEVGPRR